MYWSNLVASIASVFGFTAILVVILYIFRDKNPNRLPEGVTYDYERSMTNPRIDQQINRNAYHHTLAPSYRGAMYGLHNDRRKR